MIGLKLLVGAYLHIVSVQLARVNAYSSPVLLRKTLAKDHQLGSFHSFVLLATKSLALSLV